MRLHVFADRCELIADSLPFLLLLVDLFELGIDYVIGLGVIGTRSGITSRAGTSGTSRSTGGRCPVVLRV